LDSFGPKISRRCPALQLAGCCNKNSALTLLGIDSLHIRIRKAFSSKKLPPCTAACVQVFTGIKGPNSPFLKIIEALCAAPPEALAHSPSQMPLSCPVAPPFQREMHKDGGGGGGGVAMRARAARAPKAKSCATSCGTPSATTSATTPRPMFSTLSKDTSMPYFLYKMSICHVECSEALASVPYGIVLVRVRVRMFLE